MWQNQASLGQAIHHKNDIKPHAEDNTAGLWSGYPGHKAGQNDAIYKCNIAYSSMGHISATVQEKLLEINLVIFLIFLV